MFSAPRFPLPLDEPGFGRADVRAGTGPDRVSPPRMAFDIDRVWLHVVAADVQACADDRLASETATAETDEHLGAVRGVLHDRWPPMPRIPVARLDQHLQRDAEVMKQRFLSRANGPAGDIDK